MEFYYAQLDGDGVCCAVSQLLGETDDPGCIRIDTYDLGKLGKRYKDGEWEM